MAFLSCEIISWLAYVHYNPFDPDYILFHNIHQIRKESYYLLLIPTTTR